LRWKIPFSVERFLPVLKEPLFPCWTGEAYDEWADGAGGAQEEGGGQAKCGAGGVLWPPPLQARVPGETTNKNDQHESDFLLRCHRSTLFMNIKTKPKVTQVFCCCGAMSTVSISVYIKRV
jgi:hypothetical protein